MKYTSVVTGPEHRYLNTLFSTLPLLQTRSSQGICSKNPGKPCTYSLGRVYKTFKIFCEVLLEN